MWKLFLLFTLAAAAPFSTAFSAKTTPDAVRGQKLIASAALFQAADEVVTTYDDDCRTPKRYFVLGETVCARAENFPVFPSEPRYRRFQWGRPDGYVAQEDDIANDPEYQYFKIPSSGPEAKVGTWIVKSMDENRDGYGIGSFVVRHREIPWVNLQVSKIAPNIVFAGDKVSHTVYVYSQGPDDAAQITLTEEVPSDMTFYYVRQVGGPEFKCTTPEKGGTGRTVCTVEGMKMEEKATFTFVYIVNQEARIGTPITGGSSAYSYRTEELDKIDNEFLYTAEVGDPNEPQEPPPGEEP